MQSLYLNDVHNSKVKGLRLLNSMGFHMHITNSVAVTLVGLHINAPGDSPNTDGMHISRSSKIKVLKCIIGTGDDCISIGQGAVDVTVLKVTCGPGHGIRQLHSLFFPLLLVNFPIRIFYIFILVCYNSVGSLGKLPDELDVNGIIVKNSTLVGTENGIRIKTWPGSGPSKALGMHFSNIVMDNVGNPIIIDQNYGTNSNQVSTKTFHNSYTPKICPGTLNSTR